MALKDFFKENRVLMMGLTLPVILIVLFFLASVLPKSLVPPPQYELLYSISLYGSPTPLPFQVNFIVKEGTLYARINKNDSKNPVYLSRRLMAYNGATDSVREIGYDLSNFNEAADGSDILLEETKSMTIDSSFKSPDGYVFEGRSFGHGGLVQELFGGNYRNRSPRIKKGAVAYKIPLTPYNTNYYGDVQFIGWIVNK